MSDVPNAHAAYRRLLARPDVKHLARRFGLDRDIRYEFVGDRRSFVGKASTIEGQHQVRLPSNPRPEPYLLLTLLHEWAHLLVHRQQRKRHVAPHGPAWQRQYAMLAGAAVRAGLFPGNEEEVQRHAASGEVRTAQAQLRGPDGALLCPLPQKPEPPVVEFQTGDSVRFADRQGQWVTGTIRRVNQRTYTISAGDGSVVYRVPIGYPSLGRSDAPLAEPAAELKWRVGMAVQFADTAGRVRTGCVVRVNAKTLTVDTGDGMRFRVGYGYPSLRPAP